MQQKPIRHHLDPAIYAFGCCLVLQIIAYLFPKGLMMGYNCLHYTWSTCANKGKEEDSQLANVDVNIAHWCKILKRKDWFSNSFFVEGSTINIFIWPQGCTQWVRNTEWKHNSFVCWKALNSKNWLPNSLLLKWYHRSYICAWTWVGVYFHVNTTALSDRTYSHTTQ